MKESSSVHDFHGTTIVCVRRDGQTVMAGDGQVSFGHTVLKKKAVKVRRMADYEVLVGFAGSTADAFTLYERFEARMKDYNGNLPRAAVELAKDWRTDKFLRRLEAMLLVADRSKVLMITGNGDVVEPDEGVTAIGSGGLYAYAAARALLEHTTLPARVIAEEAMRIASDVCVYTNSNVHIEELN